MPLFSSAPDLGFALTLLQPPARPGTAGGLRLPPTSFERQQRAACHECDLEGLFPERAAASC
jgi:hypothetical protein